MPRSIAWLGAAISLALIILVLLGVAGCTLGPCASHGGSIWHSGNRVECKDGTWHKDTKDAIPGSG